MRPPGVQSMPSAQSVPRAQRVGAVGRPATFDEEFFNIILQRIGTDVQLPNGFDQLIQMLITLEETMPGSTLLQRFDIALKTVGKLTGITREQTIQVLRKQQEVVLKLREEFAKSIAADAENQKAEHAGEMQNLQHHIEQLKTQIADLERQKTADERQLATLQDSLKGIDTQLANDHAAFEATCAVIQNGAPQQKWIGIDVLLGVINPAPSGGGTRV